MSALTFDAVIRVSRRNDREGDAFMSPAEQRDAITRRAERDNVTIRRWWDETDSVSGGTVDREGLQAAISDAVKGVTDGIMVAKVDRFARTVFGGLGAIMKLEDAGAQLWSAREGVIVGDEKATATDRFIRGQWLLLAQWQRDTLTEGWEAVRHRHIGNGIANHTKYGYAKDPDTRRLVPDLDQAPWVPKMFDRRSKRWGWANIADWLTAEGAPSSQGGAWAESSVKQIVESRVYLGEIRSGDIVNENAHEPLVSLDLWQRANAVSTTKGKRRAGEPYELTSIIRCASCGVRMFGLTDHRTVGDKTYTYRYYRCRGRHGGWGRCPRPARCKADEIEAYVEGVFREKFFTGRVVPSESTDELDAALAAQADAEAELSAFLTSESTAELRRQLGDDYVEEGTNARIARVREARERVAEARNSALGVNLPSDLAEVWETLNAEERKGFLADAFAVIAVAPGKGPVEDRARIWTHGDPSIPSGLPDVGKFTGLRSISLDAPAGAGIAVS